MVKNLARAFLLYVLSVSIVAANDLNINGQVTGDDIQAPLIGVNIQVKGTTLGTVTDLDGKFRLLLSDRSEATLMFSFVGYKDLEMVVTESNTQNLNVRMQEDLFGSDEVVVTGIASTTKRANVSHSIAAVSSEKLTVVANPTLDGALSGKFAGVQVRQNSGAPGGGISVNLRGVSTLLGGSQPLYVVDGNIISNAAINNGANSITQASSGGSASAQDNPTNRIADLNMEDIERVEVLKGASAAAIYGSKAANGVILITTKSGKAGKTKINIRQNSGYTQINKKIEKKKISATETDDKGKVINPEGLFFDHDDLVYGNTGSLNETSVSISGGSDMTKYYTSVSYRDDEGIIKNTGYQKFNTRLNLDHKITNDLNVKFNTSFIKSNAQRGFTGNSNSNITYGYALALIPSYVDLRAVDGVYPHVSGSTNPLETIEHAVNDEEVLRTINSANLSYNLFTQAEQSLKLNFIAGLDYFEQDNRIYTPTFIQYEQNKSNKQYGTNSLLKTVGKVFNLNAYVSHDINIMDGLRASTSAGTQYNYNNFNSLQLVATNLIDGPKNTSLSGSNSFNEFSSIAKEQGFFVQEEINYDDMLNLSASLRADASSNHGDAEKFFYYPKFAGSFRISQLPMWNKNLLEEFKVRLAYGETGNAPVSGVKYNRISISNNGNAIGAAPRSLKATPDIRPERVKELEAGMDGILPNNLGTFEITGYFRQLEDLLMLQQLAPSSGYTSQFINGGEMESIGFEASFNLMPIKTEMFSWNTGINFSKNKSEITKLTVPAYDAAGFGSSLGVFRVEQGKSPTQIVGNDENGKPKQLGDSNPDYLLSFPNEFKAGNFDLRFLLERKEGGDVINLTGLLYRGRLADTEWENELKTWKGGKNTKVFIEDGSYWKMREVSLDYNFDRDQISSVLGNAISHLKIGLSVINMFTISDYHGYDPDVSNFGNVAIGSSIDVTPFPSSRQFYFNLSLGL